MIRVCHQEAEVISEVLHEAEVMSEEEVEVTKEIQTYNQTLLEAEVL